jgi:subtilisin family serine protease
VESALWELAGEGRPDDEVSVIVRLHEGSSPPPELRVVARFGLIVTARILRRDIADTRNRVASMKRPQAYSPAPILDGADEGAGDLQPGIGDQRRTPGLPTGQGVIVAHLDWGLDFAHPAFRTADGRTRLLALWDQGCAYDPAFPNRYGFGRIYLREEIDRALAASDPHAALGYRWWTSDRGNGSHGTHTLGISAGTAADGLPAGLAPDADLVFVDLTTRTQRGSQPLGSSTDLLEGCDFADWIAGDRPLVINASLGRQAGQHDGLTLTEQALDHFVSCRAGRAIAMSCGNYYGKAAHAQLTILPGEKRRLGLQLALGNRASELDLWYPRADRLSVGIEGPDGVRLRPLAPDERAELLHDGKVVGRLYHRRDDPNNGDNQVSLYFYGQAPAGWWQLEIVGGSVGDGRIHAWVERDPAGTSRLRFVDSDVDPRTTVGTICNGFATLAVAAYDAHSGRREPGAFSSSGPTRDGRNSRPSLAAPGCKVLSARSRPRGGGEALLVSRMSGTSMAAPHVAGAIALMFEAAPRPLWIDEARAMLIDTVDPVPEAERDRLGAGYVDVGAAVAAARGAAPHTQSAMPRPTALTPRPQLRLPSVQESEMSDHSEWNEDESFDCDADYEKEVAEGGEAGLDLDDAEAIAATMEGEGEAEGEAEVEEENRDGDAFIDGSEAYRRRRSGPGPLPFQFQIPIGGGGGLGLAVPIGGRSSPFALSLPLGGAPQPSPAAPPAPAPATAPTAPPPGGELPVTTALDLDPIAAATAHASESGELAAGEVAAFGLERDPEAEAEDDAAFAEAARMEQLERSFATPDYRQVDARYAGEQTMAAVRHAMDTGPDSSAMLLEALAEGLGGDEAAEAGSDAPSLFDLFRSLSGGGSQAARLAGRSVRVIARPGDALPASPMRGDLMLRVLPAQRWAQLSFIADPVPVPFDQLLERRLRPEGAGTPLPGRYVQVVEAWPVRRTEEDHFARRIANAADLLPLDTMLLRLLPPGAAASPDNEAEEDPSDPAAPDLRVGARGAVVTELQHRLNLLDHRRTAAGLPGLGNMPLAEDGVFGPRLRAAVEAMQRLAPPALVPSPTGMMDRASWNALALLEAASASLPAAPRAGERRQERGHRNGGIAPGQQIIERLPLLSRHRGTPPDLVIRWNAMAAAPDRVDVVVHLHGFSGLGPAMRIDRHKLPASGLDFRARRKPRSDDEVGCTRCLFRKERQSLRALRWRRSASPRPLWAKEPDSGGQGASISSLIPSRSSVTQQATRRSASPEPSPLWT